jgi:hypothetical protein
MSETTTEPLIMSHSDNSPAWLSGTRSLIAHLRSGGIKSRLIADLDPDEWDLPPKPKMSICFEERHG